MVASSERNPQATVVLERHRLTDATMIFATGPMNNLSAAAFNLLALEGVNALAKRPKVAALAMNAAAWFGGANTALKSAMTQKVVRPVVASFWVESGVVNRAIRGPRGEFHGRGKQLVTVLTDTERLSRGSLDVNSLINGAGSDNVARGKKAGVALAAQASDAIVLNAATDADRAAKENALSNARLGYMDSLGGLVAGSLDSLRVAGEAMNLQRGAAAGSLALTSIHALKFGAQMTGVFGGFLNGYVSRLKADDAKSRGWESSAHLHFTASVAFYGTGVTAGAPIGSSVLTYLAARQVGGKVVRAAALRLTAGVAAGGWIPVAGWALLGIGIGIGIGIVTSVGAALLEPTNLEAWAQQTPFGKGPVDKKFKTLKEQNEALNEALGLAAQVDPAAAQAA